MTTSPIFQQLCCELVEDHYGDFYRTIFEALAGSRLIAQHVAQKCHLPLRQAKAGLAALVQLRLVHHHTQGDSASTYSANLRNAYDIIRTGRLVEAAQARHGDFAATIVATACDLGFSTVSELRDRVLCDMTLEHHIDAFEVEGAVGRLLDDHFLVRLRKAHFGEAHDVRREVELRLLSPQQIAKLTGSKAKAEHSHNVDVHYDALVNTSGSEQGHANEHFLEGRQKPNGEAMNGVVMNGNAPRLSTLIQPNYYKIVELSQITVIGDQARKMHGRRAATVMACAVSQAASPDFWTRDNQGLHNLDNYKVVEEANASRRRNSHLEAKKPNGINGHHHQDTNPDPDLTLDDIEHELLHLNEGPFTFLSYADPSYQIDKALLTSYARLTETLRAITSRLDPPAPRILQILIQKGKLEERTLQELGLLNAKELRQSLSLLKQMGYADLQEVPRNPMRQPNQTVFLWGFEQGRVVSSVLEGVYQGMLRLLQMLRCEREGIKGTLLKCERVDVKGREEEVLGAGELAVLRRFRKVEGWVWGEIARLDGTVAVLKDA